MKPTQRLTAALHSLPGLYCSGRIVGQGREFVLWLDLLRDSRPYWPTRSGTYCAASMVDLWLTGDGLGNAQQGAAEIAESLGLPADKLDLPPSVTVKRIDGMAQSESGLLALERFKITGEPDDREAFALMLAERIEALAARLNSNQCRPLPLVMGFTGAEAADALKEAGISAAPEFLPNAEAVQFELVQDHSPAEGTLCLAEPRTGSKRLGIVGQLPKGSYPIASVQVIEVAGASGLYARFGRSGHPLTVSDWETILERFSK